MHNVDAPIPITMENTDGRQYALSDIMSQLHDNKVLVITCGCLMRILLTYFEYEYTILDALYQSYLTYNSHQKF